LAHHFLSLHRREYKGHFIDLHHTRPFVGSKNSTGENDDSVLIKCLNCETKISQRKIYCKSCKRVENLSIKSDELATRSDIKTWLRDSEKNQKPILIYSEKTIRFQIFFSIIIAGVLIYLAVQKTNIYSDTYVCDSGEEIDVELVHDGTDDCDDGDDEGSVMDSAERNIFQVCCFMCGLWAVLIPFGSILWVLESFDDEEKKESEKVVKKNQEKNHEIGIKCKICYKWIAWEKHSVAGAVSGGATGPFMGAFIGVFVAGPVGATIGFLSGLPAGAYFGGKKDRPNICESCNNELIGNCVICSKQMTRQRHSRNGICLNCNTDEDGS